MTLALRFPFFSRGEISPKLYGRVDTAAYQSGLRTARNAIVAVGGGVFNRPGTIFIGAAKYNDKYTRLIPFAFNVDDTHMLEFGHQYMRVIREDFYQLDDNTKAITNISSAVQATVTTSTTHNFTNGKTVYINNLVGMTEADESFFIVSDTTSNTFKLKSIITEDYVDSTGFLAYGSGGVVDQVYEIATPYDEADLAKLKYEQSADVLTLVHTEYQPKELQRFALNDWRLVDPEFVPSTAYPENINATNTGDTSDLIDYRYQVTAIDEETGVESLPGTGHTSYKVTAITKANPAVVTTSTAHNFVKGDPVLLTNISGMSEVNDKRFRTGNVTTDTFQLADINSTSYTTFTSATTDSAYPLFFTVQASTLNHEATLTWDSLPNIELYDVYREDNGIYAFIGETRKTTFVDTNITADPESGPPSDRNPFEFSDTWPGAVGFYQQRRAFGGSNSKPDTTYCSQPGDYTNFTTSFPVKDDDAITFRLVSGQVNQIKHYLPVNNLNIFTTGSEWVVSSGADPAFTPFTVKPDPSTNWGIAEHRPFFLGKTILFVQQDNRTVRSFGLDPDTGLGYVSTDVSLISDHIFQDHEVKDWALARTPYSAMIMTRTDGDAAMLVFNEEHKVAGWTHWDTQGDFQTVGAVRVCLELETPEPDDGIYFIVKRKIGTHTVQFVERLHKRRFSDVRDSFFVDCGVSYDNPYRITDITNTGASGSYLITCPSHPFTTDMVVDFSDIEWVPDVDTMGNETQPDQLNDTKYIVDTIPTADTFTIREISTVDTPVVPASDYNRYVKGGIARENTYLISGLQHLEGMEVKGVADGYPITATVTNGAITLAGLASRVHVGLGYTTDIELLNLETLTTSGTSQGKQKRVIAVTVRLDKSRECLVGSTKTTLTPMKRAPFQDQVSAQLYSGDNRINITPVWGTDGRLLFRQLDPLPINILAVFPEVDITP